MACIVGMQQALGVLCSVHCAVLHVPPAQMDAPKPSQVAAAATEAMLAACGTAGNRDLEPHIPALVSIASGGCVCCCC